MYVELLVVGAHNGAKLRNDILACKDKGPVILIEPIPYLFAQLESTFKGVPNVFPLQACISPTSGPQEFFAPKPEANTVAGWGDQLGSLRADHAVQHSPDFKEHVEKIEVLGISFQDLTDRFSITRLNYLFTDTEGYDCILLQTFPFLKLRPKVITFEFKHADGTFTVGKNLALLLLRLEAFEYTVKVVDSENLRAFSRF